jgi:hypothetical protein
MVSTRYVSVEKITQACIRSLSIAGTLEATPLPINIFVNKSELMTLTSH